VDVHVAAHLEPAVAGVEVPVLAVDRRPAAPELAAVEGVVVVVEADEGDAATAVLKEAVLELGLREGELVAARGRDARLAEAPEREVLVADLGLEAPVRLVEEPDARPAPALEPQANEARVRDAVVLEERPALVSVPDERRVAPVADDRDADVRAREDERRRHAVRPRREVDR
jgi:hypothetical protein